MRKTTPMRIGELWGDFLKENPTVSRNLAQARAAEVWPVVVGPLVASRTVSVSVEKGILTAVMSSAAARSELFMRREALRDAINQAVGMKVIRAVIVK